MLGKPLIMSFSLDAGENRGLYFEDTQRAIIYVRQHETLPDLYKTMTHETLHHCFKELELDEKDTLDEDMEERTISWLQWSTDGLVFSDVDEEEEEDE